MGIRHSFSAFPTTHGFGSGSQQISNFGLGPATQFSFSFQRVLFHLIHHPFQTLSASRLRLFLLYNSFTRARMHHWALFLRIIAKESSEAQPSKSWLFSYLLERYTASFYL